MYGQEGKRGDEGEIWREVEQYLQAFSKHASQLKTIPNNANYVILFSCSSADEAEGRGKKGGEM